MTINTEIKFKPFGDKVLLIEFPKEINPDYLKVILNFKREIVSKFQVNIEIISTYNALMIDFKKTSKTLNDLISELKNLYQKSNLTKDLKTKTWEIPVCYEKDFALDLISLSKTLNLSPDEIIRIHSKTLYQIYFIGFLPGFLYLGGLDERLFCSRKSTPRLSLKKGSVGIGGQQTGIYPQESPGGWHIIGNSPINFFNPKKLKPSPFKAGDFIAFKPISLKEYQEITQSIKLKNHSINQIV